MKKRETFIAVMVGIIITVCLSGCLFKNDEAKYIASAKAIIENNLKDPSSAEYNDAYVYEEDDYGRAIVYLDVTAKNSWGGVTREKYYVCINEVKDDGTFTYNKLMPYCTAEDNSSLSTLKSINDFGEKK